MPHGYGFTRIRYTPSSPAPAYLTQLTQLRPILLGDSNPEKPKRIREILKETGISKLPEFPEGKHVIVDLMSFYFGSSDANDLCYRAAIGRDTCRGLKNSQAAPAPLKGKK